MKHRTLTILGIGVFLAVAGSTARGQAPEKATPAVEKPRIRATGVGTGAALGATRIVVRTNAVSRPEKAALVPPGAPVPRATVSSSTPPSLEKEAVQALKEQRFGLARQRFTESLFKAEDSGERKDLGRARFFLGLADQEQAAVEFDEGRRKELLNGAAASYRAALEAAPDAAGTWNNLGRVEWDLGRTNQALAAMSRAVELNDERRGYYSEQYADMLLKAGRWRDACRHYAAIAGEQPGNRGIHRKMVATCMANGPDLLGWYLWDLAKAGQVIQVQNHVLGVVSDAVWTESQRSELMALLAYCLARKSETDAEFLESDAARRLAEFGSNPALGRASKGILHLYGPGPLNRSEALWWAREFEPGQESRRGVWPLEAFLELVRSRADRAAENGDSARREAFYLYAVGLRSGYPDPEALFGLANFYSENKKPEKIRELLDRYQVDIFEAKGQAYTQAQTEKIFRYHTALGVIYSELDQWSTPRQVDSAQFQLQRALDTAAYLNTNSPSGSGGSGSPLKPVFVPPQLVELLADGYHKNGQAERAIETRFAQAERYVELDQPDAASRVMAPVGAYFLPVRPPAPPGNVALPAASLENYRTRWRSIETDIQKKQASPPSSVPGRVQIHLAPEANSVAGGYGRVRLSDTERRSLESALGDMVGSKTSSMLASFLGRAVRTFDTNLVSADVQEITVNGTEGRALLKRGTNLVQVPFRLDTGPDRPEQNFRFFRP